MLAFKTSSTIFSVTIIHFPRRLEDVLQDGNLFRWRRPQDVMKISWRRLRDKQNIYWGYLYLTNLYLANLYLTDLAKENPKYINKNPINSIFVLFWNSSTLFILIIKISENCSVLWNQFVIFRLLSYCFKETIWFDVKASFASRPVSRLIRWYNKPGDITKEFWEKAIQFHRTFHRLKITNWNQLN